MLRRRVAPSCSEGMILTYHTAPVVDVPGFSSQSGPRGPMAAGLLPIRRRRRHAEIAQELRFSTIARRASAARSAPFFFGRTAQGWRGRRGSPPAGYPPSSSRSASPSPTLGPTTIVDFAADAGDAAFLEDGSPIQPTAPTVATYTSQSDHAVQCSPRPSTASPSPAHRLDQKSAYTDQRARLFRRRHDQRQRQWLPRRAAELTHVAALRADSSR